MHLSKLFFLLIGIVICSPSLAKNWSYSVDYLRGESTAQGLKLAIQYHTDWSKKKSDKWHLYFESSIHKWEHVAFNNTDINYGLSISPIFQYPIGYWKNKQFYIEVGVGISFLDDTTFAGKNISTHYQFEDRIGVSMRFDKFKNSQIALRYFHYSNGGFKKPNPGLDFLTLSYTYSY